MILRLPRTQFIHTRMRSSFVSETMFPRLATGAQNILFPANLATPDRKSVV